MHSLQLALDYLLCVELLTRLRLYTCAAYLRKYCAAEEIRKTTLVCRISIHRCFNVYFHFCVVGNDDLYLMWEMPKTSHVAGWHIQRQINK